MDWNKLQLNRRVCPPGSPEGVKLDLFPFGFFLMVRTSNKNVQHQVQNGFAQFRAIRAGVFLVFLFRFGTLPWQSVVFHLSEAQSKRVPQPWTGRGLPLHIVFVDANRGELRAKRIEELSPELSRRMVSIVSAQDANDPLLNRDIFVRRIFFGRTAAKLAILANMRDHIDI